MSQVKTMVWEVRSTGTDSNGGGFDSTAAGTDRSQQDAAQVVIDNSVIKCTTPGANSNTLTFTQGYTPSSADVGNAVKITGGTNITTGFFVITAQSSTTWTLQSLTVGNPNLTTSGGAGASVTGNMGGAFASPAIGASVALAGNLIYVKAATYSMSSSSNAAGGCISMPTGSSGSPSTPRLIGYSTVRGDLGRPTFQATGTSYSIITTGNNNRIENIIVDGNSGTGITGMTCSSGTVLMNCKAINCKSHGFTGPGSSQDVLAYFCEATTCSTTSAFFQLTGYGCVAHDNTFTGFDTCSGSFCISCNNTGVSSDGLISQSVNSKIMNWVLYGNGRDGIRTSTSNTQHNEFINCISYGNTGKGFNNTAADNGTLFNCAFGSNTGGDIGGTVVSSNQIGTITLTSNPFTNAAGNNFSLNNTAGGGALCRAAGVLGSYPSGISTTSYMDVGAAQHADPVAVAGMLVHPGMSGGARG